MGFLIWCTLGYQIYILQANKCVWNYICISLFDQDTFMVVEEWKYKYLSNAGTHVSLFQFKGSFNTSSQWKVRLLFNAPYFKFLFLFLLCSIFMWNMGYAVNLSEMFLIVENDFKLRSNIVLKAYTKLCSNLILIKIAAHLKNYFYFWINKTIMDLSKK